MVETEQKVQMLFEDFQMRHQRCIQRCRDLAVENISGNQQYVSEKDQAKAEVRSGFAAHRVSTSHPPLNFVLSTFIGPKRPTCRLTSFPSFSSLDRSLARRVF